MHSIYCNLAIFPSEWGENWWKIEKKNRYLASFFLFERKVHNESDDTWVVIHGIDKKTTQSRTPGPFVICSITHNINFHSKPSLRDLHLTHQQPAARHPSNWKVFSLHPIDFCTMGRGDYCTKLASSLDLLALWTFSNHSEISGKFREIRLKLSVAKSASRKWKVSESSLKLARS